MSHEYHGKTRFIFSDYEHTPRPGELQAHRDLGKEMKAIADEHGRPAPQVVAHMHVQSRIAKHKGQQKNFNRPRVAPSKPVSVKAPITIKAK